MEINNILDKLEKKQISVNKAIRMMNQEPALKTRKSYWMLVDLRIGWFPLFLILPTFLEGIVYLVTKGQEESYRTFKQIFRTLRKNGPGLLCHVLVEPHDFNDQKINVKVKLL